MNSITTPEVEHDNFNALVELILLNETDFQLQSYPWKEHKSKWGKNLAILKKIHKVHKLTFDQLAFYIFKNKTKNIASEYGKVAVVASRLWRNKTFDEIIEIYRFEYLSKGQNQVVVQKSKVGKKKKSILEVLEEFDKEK